MIMTSIREQILIVAETRSVFNAADIDNKGSIRTELGRMVASGELIRVERGLYALADSEVSQHHSLVAASKLYPGGVICLISALYFHGIGTQMPYETWIMRADKNQPSHKAAAVRFMYCSGAAFDFAVEKHMLEGSEVSIYSPAKTVADCFKYRNKIGLDVALEALKEGWSDKRFSLDELWSAAKVCRVQNVMQPYVEMLVQ